MVMVSASVLLVTVGVLSAGLRLVAFPLEQPGGAAFRRLALALALAFALALLVGRAVAAFGMVVVGAPAGLLLLLAGLPGPLVLVVLGWFVKVLWIAGPR